MAQQPIEGHGLRVGITSPCQKTEVNDQPASIGVMCGQYNNPSVIVNFLDTYIYHNKSVPTQISYNTE